MELDITVNTFEYKRLSIMYEQLRMFHFFYLILLPILDIKHNKNPKFHIILNVEM